MPKFSVLFLSLMTLGSTGKIIQLLIALRMLLDFKSLEYGFLDLLTVFAAILMVIDIKFEKPRNTPHTGFMPLMIFPILIASSLISLSNTSDKMGVLKFIIKFLLLLVVIQYARHMQDLELIKWKIFLSNLVTTSAAMNILEYSFGINLFAGITIDTKFERSAGFFLWPNIACISYGIILIHTFFESKFVGWKRLIRISLLTLAILSTASLSGTIGILVSLCYISWRKGIRHFIITSFSILMIFVFLSINTRLVERFSNFKTPSSEMVLSEKSQDSFTWRIIQWRRVVKEIGNSPIIGHGIGSSSDLTLVDGYLPHNDYLRILLDTGIFGFIILLCGLIVLLKKIHRSNLKILNKIELHSYLILMVIACFGENVINQTTIYCLVPMFLNFGGKVSANRNSEKD